MSDTATVTGSGRIPEAPTSPLLPSIWPPGDPHYTYEHLAADSPGGVLAQDPHALVMAQKDAEIESLRAQLAAANPPPADPRDAEIEQLRAELAAKENPAEVNTPEGAPGDTPPAPPGA